MPVPQSLDERIARLRNEVADPLRTELQNCLLTLRQARDPIGVLLRMSRASLMLLDVLFASVNERRPSDDLHACILRAAEGSMIAPGVSGLHLLPPERATYLQSIRILANKADQAAEQARLGIGDAENALNLLLGVVEWFYCECRTGPGLDSIYRDINGDADAGDAALEALDLAAEELADGADVTLPRVCHLLEVAISFGVPVYNAGGHLECAQIYARASQGIATAIATARDSGISVSESANRTARELVRVLRRFASPRPANDKKMAWALRHVFDHAAEMAVLDQGTGEIDHLFERARSVGRTADAAVIGAAIRIALANGNGLFRQGRLRLCALLHLHTARRMLDAVNAGPDQKSSRRDGQTAQAVAKLLSPLVDIDPGDSDESAEALAWQLYNAFIDIMGIAENAPKTNQ